MCALPRPSIVLDTCGTFHSFLEELLRSAHGRSSSYLPTLHGECIGNDQSIEVLEKLSVLCSRPVLLSTPKFFSAPVVSAAPMVSSAPIFLFFFAFSGVVTGTVFAPVCASFSFFFLASRLDCGAWMFDFGFLRCFRSLTTSAATPFLAFLPATKVDRALQALPSCISLQRNLRNC